MHFEWKNFGKKCLQFQREKSGRKIWMVQFTLTCDIGFGKWEFEDGEDVNVTIYYPPNKIFFGKKG
jgi:hypothetical protein